MQTKLIQIKDYLLLIDEEAEIQKGDLMYDNHLVGLCNCTKVVNKLPYSYTSSFLNVDKVIAYYPLTKEAKELDLPKLPHFEVTKSIEHLAEEKADVECQIDSSLDYAGFYKGFISGYKEAQSKQFSLEDMINAFDEGTNVGALSESLSGEYDSYEEMENADEYFDESRETFIQSLSTQQLPKEFKPIMVCGRCLKPDDNDEDCWSAKECSRNTDFPDTFKTITNSEGKQEIQGRYVY